MIRGFTVEQVVNSFDDRMIAEAVNDVRREGYYDYHVALDKRAKALDTAAGALLGVLGDACSMCLTNDGKVYGPHITLAEGRRSPSIEDFVGELAEVLQGVFDKISNELLKSRIADVLWVNRKLTGFQKPIRFAIAALDAYCLIDVDYDLWYAGRCETLWFRAISLAMGLGMRGEQYVNRLAEKLLAVFQSCAGGEESLLIPMARLFFESKIPLERPQEIPLALERRLLELKDVKDIIGQNACYDLLAKWYERLALTEKFEECLFLKAEANRAVGDQWSQDQVEPGMVSARYEEAQRCYDKLSRAFKVRHRVPDLVKTLRRSTHAAYQKMSANMQPIYGKRINIGKYIESTRKEMHGLDFATAIYKFLRLHRTRVDDLRVQAREIIRKCPTMSFFAWTTFDNGRVVSRTEGIDPRKDGIEETPRFHQMLIQLYDFQIELLWKSCLWPAFMVLKEEHHIADSDCFDMVSQSRFVPENRRFMFARGIWAGFNDDFQTAAALLLPQLENAVRFHLKAYDCDTVYHDVGKEIDSELGLSNLVGRDDMKFLFDEDFRFELLVLFGSPPNFNLRNRYAHGLVDDCEGCCIYDFFVWYVSLRFVVYGCQKHPERLGLKLPRGTKNVRGSE